MGTSVGDNVLHKQLGANLNSDHVLVKCVTTARHLLGASDPPNSAQASGAGWVGCWPEVAGGVQTS